MSPTTIQTMSWSTYGMANSSMCWPDIPPATIPFPATEAFLKEQGTKWAPIVQAFGLRVE